jgi:hypothetical protein
LLVASNLLNLIHTAFLLCGSQKDLASGLVRAGVLERLLEAVPIEGPLSFTKTPSMAGGALAFIPWAIGLICKLSIAPDCLNGGDCSLRIVRWCAALLGQVSIIFQHEDKAQLSNSFQKAVLEILIVMDMKAKQCEGAFDFKPSIRRLQEILQYMPGDTTQQVGQILVGLKRASQTRPTVKKDFTAGVDMIIGMASDPRDGLRFAGMQNVLQWVPIDARCLALGELTNFLHKSATDEAYEQADLHEQPSLESLVVLTPYHARNIRGRQRRVLQCDHSLHS